MRHDKIMTTPAITKYEGVRETVRFANALRAEAQGFTAAVHRGGHSATTQGRRAFESGAD
jgi:hypothetical protein